MENEKLKEIKLIESITLSPILSDKFLRTDVDTVDVYVAEIKEKEKISKVVVTVGKMYPDLSLAHLKRIRPPSSSSECFQIVVTRTTATARSELEDQLASLGVSNISVCQVPATPPLTRTQFEASKKVWPSNFHENKQLEKSLTGKSFGAKELQLITRVFQNLLRTSTTNRNVAGASVYDKEFEIASALDSSHNNPLQHCVMKVIDEVAFAQGGGAWHQQASGIQSSHADEPEEKRMLPYLCTTYDLYVTCEPCAMCAMALVHSRIKRVFFLGNSCCNFDTSRCCPSDGALSRLKVHVSNELNHNFEVWKIHTNF